MPSQPVTPTGAWTLPLAVRPQSRLRLICFHPAGAGAYLYRGWAAALPADVDLFAVQLPGRENRLAEPCLTDYQQAVTELSEVLRPLLLDGPYAFFGHSMGAMLAYGVAAAAARRGDPLPHRLLLSGCGGPGTPQRKPGRGHWTDDDLVADLREMGGTPEEVLAQPELLELILPTLRADYTLCDGYYRDHREPVFPPLACPVSIFGGVDDLVSRTDLERWTATTRAGSSVRMFPGGHFYLTGESRGPLLSALTAELATA
ncbi:alpha/beta fold hydrolase [Kitasatospora sp. NBC_01287]|uniref:thioesterase II family protein n=1 Tax=Kitasatospora sp. NBC_01287 TaxID=2903573 RepID=UPI002253C65B|nr:alpha/beta fold hydrolase [Kitasatospora sp. NBC_01287]MCX4744974.1 alpha/beta fold hydrolase [Kitasatospora sp. NBC_01287]